MREAWKEETYVRCQSFSSESAVKYLHVGRRKIQIPPPPGEQDQSNVLPQGQQRESPQFVSLNIPFLVKGTKKESQFYKFTVIVANEPWIH